MSLPIEIPERITPSLATAPSQAAKLNLCVIRVRDIVASARFYSSVLNLTFTRHQHGEKLPVHFACESEDIVFELYPQISPNDPPTTMTRIGFAVTVGQADDGESGKKVARVSEICERCLAAGGEVKQEPKMSPWGVCAVLADVDGHKVEVVCK